VGEILYAFAAAPSLPEEIRPGAGNVELRIAEDPTGEVAANVEQSAIELRFSQVNDETAWAMVEVWPDRENLVCGGFRANLHEAFAAALGPYEAARTRRRLASHGFAWAVVDVWTSVVRLDGRSSVSKNEHVIAGGFKATARKALNEGRALFMQTCAKRRG